MSRDCATPAKGKGKDGKGGQKGYGKGGHQHQQQPYQHHHRSEGKGGKGSRGCGKGYKGTCGRCGQVGHKAAECTKHVHIVQEASPREVQEVEVGGVCMVGVVDGYWKTPKKPTMKMSEAPAKGGGQFDSNGFRVLDDWDDHEDDSEEDVFIGLVESTKRHECGRPSLSKTRISAMKLHVARCRPLASAAKIVKAGNSISMGPEEADN